MAERDMAAERHCRAVDERQGLRHWCPGAGFTEIWNWINGWGTAAFNENLNFQAPAASVRRRMFINAPQPDETFSLYATARVPYKDDGVSSTWQITCAFMAHWVPSSLAMMMGTLVAEGLARTTSNSGNWIKLHENATSSVFDDLAFQGGRGASEITFEWSNTDPNGPIWLTRDNQLPIQLVSFDLDAQQYGYGSAITGPTGRFAVAVMFIYYAILGVYFAAALCMRVKTIIAWGDLQDLAVLVWNSPPLS
ncbi:hypothetical protein B0H67DRAFT_558170 [Lasiosphaeris hirsuta]|uniref:Uncharacterized protein n=1 Tax=Lasiosphaeris hirsuta TaxID=260670 RepID=A0AA39ZXT7_9PEZI|nr:hypothetical protein B0H67DRAFT_558170 [Lasiosphaeris hirsuta]